MLGRISTTHLRVIFNSNSKICSFLPSLSPLKFHQQYTISASLSDSSSSSVFSNKLRNTHLESPLATVPHIGKLVFSKWSSLLNRKVDNFSTANVSLNELLLRISHVCPETCRKFLRLNCWTPEHMLEILLAFELGSQNLELDAKTVESLWELFRRVGGKNEGYKHLPKSCEVMASMLINVGMLRDVEYLLSVVESQGILLACDEIFSGVIEGHVNAGELDRALFMYDKMKGQSLVLSLLCCRSLIDVLVKGHKADYAIRVYEDLVEGGFEFGHIEARNLEILIRFLCQDGKIKKARKLLRNIVPAGWKASGVVLSEVADVYCEKKDFEDLLSFFVEMRCIPDVLVGNKIIYSLCCHCGIKRADSFLWELECLGFSPNENTFGILINWCCLNGKLRDAFVYMSEILSRGLKPDRRSYNALVSGLFKAGMQEHARHILNEMVDNGTEPNLATFRTLLAGYSKARQFNEVKLLINEMTNSGLVLSSMEDPISKAFSVLGLNPLTVKLKRDNDVRNFRTEFVDELGNGLYLDTNLDEFEKTVSSVLEESLIQDFNLLVMRQCSVKNVKRALLMVEEMALWGQELSHPVLSALIRLLCETKYPIETIPGLVDKMSRLLRKMDDETLNLFAQALSKKGFAEKCRLLLDEMDRRQLPITNDTYASVLMSLCKFGRVTDICFFWDLAWKGNWSPELKDFVAASACLCQRKMLDEVLELYDIMLAWNRDSRMQICNVFLENLCSAGFTDVGLILIKELSQICELDCTVYSHLIRGYCQEKKYSEALMIFDTFPTDNLALSSDALLSLVPNLCKANRFDEAVALKDRCIRDHPSIALSLYNALIKGCSKAGKLAEADVLFREMLLKNILPDNEIYHNLLQGHCQSSDLKTAKELFCVMIRRDISFCLSSYRDLLCLFCKRGTFHTAMGLKRLMLVGSKYSCTVIYNIFLFYLFQTGKYALVDAVLDELDKMGVEFDGIGYNFLVHGFSVCKDMPRSMKYLNDMIIKGIRPSNRSLGAVICYLCSNGQVQNALQITNQIELRGWSHCSTVQFALLEGLLSDGRMHEAENILAQIMEKDLIPDTHDNLIKKFVQHGRLELAVELLDHILTKRSIPDSVSYDCIIQKFCNYNNFARAMDFLTEMIYRNLKPSTGTWEMLVENFCVNGQTTEAEGLLISMAKVGDTPTRRMFAFVIDRYRLENNWSKASEVLHRMQQHGYEPDFTTQWSLICSLNNSNDQDGSIRTGGFLSKLLVESGFPSGGSKSKDE